MELRPAGEMDGQIDGRQVDARCVVGPKVMDTCKVDENQQKHVVVRKKLVPMGHSCDKSSHRHTG